MQYSAARGTVGVCVCATVCLCERRGEGEKERESLVLESKQYFARFLLLCSTAIFQALNGIHH